MWLAAAVGLWREQMTGAAAGVQRRRRRVLCGAALVPAGPREIGRGAIPAARAVRGEDGRKSTGNQRSGSMPITITHCVP